MKTYRGYVIGTDWNFTIEAAGYYISDGCTRFFIEDGTIIALYPTTRLVIYEISKQ